VLLLPGLAGRARLFVFELPVVHHADHRGPRVRRYLHEVQGLLLRTLPRLLESNDTDLFALIVDQTNGADPDLLVDADSFVSDGVRLLA
jgi:hypothetical protein